MKRIIIALLLLPLCVALLFITDFLTGYSVNEDVSYGDTDANVMDIFMPSNLSETEGAVLFIHGGSWSGGDKAEEEIRCRILANSGYIAATMNYTLYSDDTQMEHEVDVVLDEITSALEQLKSFAADQGVTIEKVGISGYSAGAHLAMLYSYSRADESPVEIAFVSSMAGPADISREVWGDQTALTIGNWLSIENITPTMFGNGQADKILSDISPITYVGENTPPTMLIHGSMDNVVPIENAENLMEKLDEFGIDYDYINLPDSDHSLLQNPKMHLDYYLLLIDYCDEYLK